MKKILKILFIFVLIISLSALSILTYFYIITKDARLDTNKLTISESSVTFYDKNNNEISDISLDTDKSNAKVNELPDYIKFAFISTEDRHFYSHNGIDYKRVVKAGLKNIASFSYKEGASTISQQLIKNTHLTNEKTLKRKLLEMKLTQELENKYTKNEIIELYLNSIYFGENSFGIQKASKLYFNKNAKDLSIAESAMLAAIIKAPSTYSPYLNPDKCLARRNFVLENMHEQNYINDIELREAKNITIPTDYYKINSSNYLRQAYKELQDITKLSPYVLADGCKIYTYLDNSLQEYLEKLQIDEIENFNKSSVIIDNNTNGITAYISSTGNINRMPGSVIKPLLVYAPALENNIINPASLIIDEPTAFGSYSPRNYNDVYYGYVNMKQALSKSLNVPSVKILNYTGIENSKKYLDKMNLYLTNQDDSLTIALGGLSYGLPLIELTNGYSVFANKGIYKNSSFIEKIEDKNGNLIYQNKKEKIKVFSEGTSFLINDTLKQTVNVGTAKNLKGFNFELAAKTGTVGIEKGNSDAYCVCYTSEYTIGSWVGNKEELMPNNITGGTYPAVINKKLLEKIYVSKTPSNFFETDEVAKVKLDKLSYENDHIVEQADKFTPKDYYIEEYFKTNNLPTSKSDRFFNPKIENANISIEKSTVKIELCVAEYYEYAVYCEFDGKNKQIYDSIDDERNSTIFDTAKKNGIYKYTIIPYFVFDEQKILGTEYSLPEIKTKIDTVINPHDDRDDNIKDKDDWWSD
jgi:membrane peptidoglycan carboxypeptidase